MTFLLNKNVIFFKLVQEKNSSIFFDIGSEVYYKLNQKIWFFFKKYQVNIKLIIL